MILPGIISRFGSTLSMRLLHAAASVCTANKPLRLHRLSGGIGCTLGLPRTSAFSSKASPEPGECPTPSEDLPGCDSHKEGWRAALEQRVAQDIALQANLRKARAVLRVGHPTAPVVVVLGWAGSSRSQVAPFAALHHSLHDSTTVSLTASGVDVLLRH
eukprot:RCo003026